MVNINFKINLVELGHTSIIIVYCMEFDRSFHYLLNFLENLSLKYNQKFLNKIKHQENHVIMYKLFLYYN